MTANLLWLTIAQKWNFFSRKWWKLISCRKKLNWIYLSSEEWGNKNLFSWWRCRWIVHIQYKYTNKHLIRRFHMIFRSIVYFYIVLFLDFYWHLNIRGSCLTLYRPQYSLVARTNSIICNVQWVTQRTLKGYLNLICARVSRHINPL